MNDYMKVTVYSGTSVELSHEDVKRTLNFNLIRREFPFDWRTQELSATLYQGNPHVAYPQKIDVSESLVSGLRHAVLEMTAHDHHSDENLPKEIQHKNERFWDAVAEELREKHKDDEMISFHMFEFREDEFFLRYHVIK